MGYRLGLDLGTNSIGWCMLGLAGGTPQAIMDMGSRVFPDGRNPKDGSSLAVGRRGPRQARRRRDRYLDRREWLLETLTKFGLMPEDMAERKKLEKRDPYRLRRQGLDHRLSLSEFGRAIFHLNQRRGFKSNRKTDKEEKKKGKIKTAVEKLRAMFEEKGAQTLGEFLDLRREQGQSVRCRLQGQGAKAAYEFYAERAMVEEEFDTLWDAQARFYPELTHGRREEVRYIIFHQRPLKPVDPGRCLYEPQEERAPRALPEAQQFRIFQELDNLRVNFPGQPSRDLTDQERHMAAAKLLSKKDVAFTTLRTTLGLEERHWFNLEGPKRKKLCGDATAAILAGKNLFGPGWRNLGLKEQTRVVERLLDEEDEGVLVRELMEEWGLDQTRAHEVAVAAAKLPTGYARVGRTALSKITAAMREEGVGYAKAVPLAGYGHHSDSRPDARLERLPYYGEVLVRHTAFGTSRPEDMEAGRVEKYWGRIANPTVHIVLNQLRKLVNELITAYGPPEQIVVELGRDLKRSLEQRKEMDKEQAKNQEANERRRNELREQGERESGNNVLKLRLWEELGENPLRRCCPYSGEQLSRDRLFSPEVEIDHILPFSRTLDKGKGNPTICLTGANRFKGRRSPFEAFQDSPQGYDWEDILSRVTSLPKAKRWRFAPDAMEQFEDEEKFLSRHLEEMRYVSRLAREYLGHICNPDEVRVTPGKLTGLLRAKWGLRKDRHNHRHHAMDAAVIAVTDRAMLQRVSRAAAETEEEGIERVLEKMPEPWTGFRQEVERALEQVVVSHKPDRDKGGGLHNDTAYALLRDGKGKPLAKDNAVHRIPLLDMVNYWKEDATEIEVPIRDRRIRREVKELLQTTPKDKCKEALQRYSEENGVGRVRIVQTLSNPITICHGKDPKTGKPRFSKSYKGDHNAYCEIFRQPDGSWDWEVISTFEANRPGFVSGRQRKGLPLVMRLFKNDMVAFQEGVQRKIAYVVKFSDNGLLLVEHFEANHRARNDDRKDAFKYKSRKGRALQTIGCRRVSVDILGRVKDPGPGEK